jgi:hypothetical protein
MPANGFLTDRQREVLSDYDSSDADHRGAKSRATRRARGALDDLIWLAGCVHIDHREIYDPDALTELLVLLLTGNSGLIYSHEMDDDGNTWTPDPDIRNEWYAAIVRAQHAADRFAENRDRYEMKATEVETIREQPETPDDRDVKDINTIEECDRCEWSPAAIIQTADGWECYNCGHDPDE